MSRRGKWRRWLSIVVGALALAGMWILAGFVPGGEAAPSAAAAQSTSEGQAIYEQRCAGCHGVTGDGQGPAAGQLFVKPRDFTRDEYEIKSTAGDEFPSREDLIRT
ncbi:MAG TPA: c-type cytochrome, partial [Anaerolineae bacterium]